MSKLLTVSGLALASLSLNTALQERDTVWIEPPYSVEQPVEPRLVQIASLGHVPTTVDAILIRSLGDPAYDPVPPGTHPPLYFELLLTTALDPEFSQQYSYGASILSVVRRDGPGAQEILERAHRQILEGKLQDRILDLELFRGYNALFETQDFEVATNAFQTVALVPGVHPVYQRLAERLQTVEGRFVVAFRTLNSMLSRKNDEKIEAQLLERKRELELAQRLFNVNQEFRNWLKTRTASAVLFDRFRGLGNGDLVWDPRRNQVETRLTREPVPGFY